MISKSIIFTNIPSEISITFPAELLLKYLNQDEIDDFFDEIKPFILQKLQSKNEQLKFLL